MLGTPKLEIESEFIIKEPKIPWFNRILFSFLFTGYITLVIYFYNRTTTEKFTDSDIYKIIFYLVFLLFYFFRKKEILFCLGL